MPSITDTNAIEEETYDDYVAEQFYPAHIGEVIKSPQREYEIIGKLGFGRHSTVWLCRQRGCVYNLPPSLSSVLCVLIVG